MFFTLLATMCFHSVLDLTLFAIFSWIAWQFYFPIKAEVFWIVISDLSDITWQLPRSTCCQWILWCFRLIGSSVIYTLHPPLHSTPLHVGWILSRGWGITGSKIFVYHHHEWFWCNGLKRVVGWEVHGGFNKFPDVFCTGI